MSQLDRTIRRSNAILAGELGSADGHHAAFAWHWADSLRAPFPCEDANGDPIYDYQCACGENVRVHHPGCVIEWASQRFEVMRMLPHLISRWVLCRWIPPPSEASWRRSFGSLNGYPANGSYVPLSVNAQVVALKPGMEPTEDLTWKLVHAVKSQQTAREALAAYTAHKDLQESTAVFGPKGEVVSRPPSNAPWWGIRDQIRERMTTFGQIPGSKASHVSYPDPEAAKKETKEKVQ